VSGKMGYYQSFAQKEVGQNILSSKFSIFPMQQKRANFLALISYYYIY